MSVIQKKICGLACLAMITLFASVTLHAADNTDHSRMLHSAFRLHQEHYVNNELLTGHGTAFGVDLSAWGMSGRRYLLSAGHNVLDNNSKPCGTITIEVIDGSRTYWSQCKVLFVDPELDLCLLESSDTLPAISDLAERDVQLNDNVVMAGSPRGVKVALYDGIMRKRYHQGTARSVVDIQFDHGCSGGPLYNSKTGQIVGVAVAGIPQDGDLDHARGLFVPINAVESFLDRAALNPKLRAVATSTPQRTAERVVALKNSVHTAPILDETPDAIPTVFVIPTPTKTTHIELPMPKHSRSMPVVDHSLPAKDETVTKIAATPAGEFVAPATKPMLTEIPASYVVEEGDNLTRIAKKFNLTLPTLMSINGIKDPNRILIGSKLHLK